MGVSPGHDSNVGTVMSCLVATKAQDMTDRLDGLAWLERGDGLASLSLHVALGVPDRSGTQARPTRKPKAQAGAGEAGLDLSQGHFGTELERRGQMRLRCGYLQPFLPPGVGRGRGE